MQVRYDPRTEWAEKHCVDRLVREDGGLGVFSNWISTDVRITEYIPPSAPSTGFGALQLMFHTVICDMTVSRCNFKGDVLADDEGESIVLTGLKAVIPAEQVLSVDQVLLHFHANYKLPEYYTKDGWVQYYIATDHGILFATFNRRYDTDIVQANKPFRLLPQMLGVASTRKKPTSIMSSNTHLEVIDRVEENGTVIVTRYRGNRFKLDPATGYWAGKGSQFFTILGTRF